ncbi:MAG: HAD family hydrolase [Candidatus Dormibacteria bacterium]
MATSPIDAIVFDFDGLILETEEPILLAWQEIYAEHGIELPLELWTQTLGTADHWFDPYRHLATATGRDDLDEEQLVARRRRRHDEMLAEKAVLPGVLQYIEDARRRGISLAVASSSSHAWVEGHLERLRLRSSFAAVRCREDATRTKPDPELYQLAVAALGTTPARALAIEDSPNGITAAKAAGMWCLAVPSILTRTLDLGQADWAAESLAALPLGDLLKQIPLRPDADRELGHNSASGVKGYSRG